MAGTVFWPWLSLPLAAFCGAGCVAVARAYARRIALGADIDGACLWAAFLAVLMRRETAPPPVAAALCAMLLLAAALPFALQPTPAAAAQLAACAVLLLLALIDTYCGLLPDALTLPLLWAGLMLAWAGVGPDLHDAVAAAAAAYLLLRALDAAFQVWRGRAGLGGGDMKLVAALGAWLGWAPLPGVMLAACCGGILFVLCRQGGAAWRASLAFGPFLALAGAAGLAGGPVVQFLF